jgi:hypothetical protein
MNPKFFLLHATISIIFFPFLFCSNPVDSDPSKEKFGTIVIKTSVPTGRVFPFIPDSAVATVSGKKEIIIHPLSLYGDSVTGSISVPLRETWEITVTVFDTSKGRWCTGKDTLTIDYPFPHNAYIKLKQVQTNVITDDTIPGHRLVADELWQGNCILKGDIIISPDTRLTVAPNSIIKIATGNPDWDSSLFKAGIIEIYCNGSFFAQGKSDSIIVFTTDSTSPRPDSWWGIGASGDYHTMEYCHISGAYTGFFVFSGAKSVFVKNCLFSCSGTGVVTTPTSISFSKLTFDSVEHCIHILGDLTSTEIDFCNFPRNSHNDIFASGNKQSITVRNSNFSKNRRYNLFFLYSDEFNKITAENCYNIVAYGDTANGTFNFINSASEPIEGAGCGFSGNF